LILQAKAGKPEMMPVHQLAGTAMGFRRGEHLLEAVGAEEEGVEASGLASLSAALSVY
jgi:hypothetical protein